MAEENFTPLVAKHYNLCTIANVAHDVVIGS